MKREVVITGIGTVTAHGMTVSDLWNDVIAGQSAIRKLEPPFDTTRIQIGAMVPNYDPNDHFEQDELSILDRASQFAVLAARDAITDSGLGTSQLSDAAAIIGSGCGGKETDEQTYAKLYRDGSNRAHPLTIPRGMPSASASMVSTHLGIHGPTFMVSSACASGAHAIIQGSMMIEAGLADVAVVGGTDAPFTHGLLKSWDALRVTTSDTCRPFSEDRSGIVLGEGAGMLVLESRQHAENRTADIYASLSGYSMTADAGHITRPDQSRIETTMKGALDHAGLSPQDISYINAHGTGTAANDSTEAAAINEVFGYEHAPVVSSTKGAHGHALGASSAIEFIISVLSIKHQQLPPTTNFGVTDETCKIKHAHLLKAQPTVTNCMTNSFAFGGLNSSIVVS